jgi:hypothetical protein
MAPRSPNSDFLADGCNRAWKALEPEIRRQVEAEYAEAWKASGLLRRWFVRRRIEAEVRRRLTERAPPDAFY